MENQTSLDNQNEVIADLVKRTRDSNNPKELWSEAVELARSEEKAGGAPSLYPDLGVEEIVNFGEKLQQMNSIEEKYRLMMEETQSGELWYNVLLGDDNMRLFSQVESIVEGEYHRTGKKWGKAIDIGTGIGNTLRAISPFCEQIVGVDFAQFALQVAQRSSLPENASLVLGKAEELPIADHSADLVVSNGLLYYLSPTETHDFVSELSRILKVGGKFYHSAPLRDDGEIVPKVFQDTLESAKNALINVLDSIANGGGNPNSLGLFELHKLLLENEFELTLHDQDSENKFLLEYTRIPDNE